MITAGQLGLGTFADGAGEAFPGLVCGDRVLDLRRRFGSGTTVLGLLEDWDGVLPVLWELSAAGDTRALELGSLRPLPPVMARQVLCAGANYYRHVREIVVSTLRLAGDARSEAELREEADRQVRRAAEGEPYLFAGLPGALAGANDDIVLWGPGRCHDWELELAVVIGRPARNVSQALAMSHVAGYTIANDISTRDVMNRPGFPMTDFLMSKCRPSFLPTGPYIVPRELVADPRALRITLSVNGEVMQDESVDDIIHGVEALVAYASSVVALWPGDLILTGSPAGNAGQHGDRWLVPGDLIEGRITGLGVQRNRCVAPAQAPAAR
ncbi:MAG TPA: fumarylacetoacetate hydrolase family protein [Solirubrobacteraceae bacterium]|nr:fumarylacetoacetate hydrolase family protein [Solirubrobacteraceae bacterium]